MRNNLKNKIMIFQEIDGIWRRVDSQEPLPPTLAEIENQLNIVIDENCEYCRIIRYYDKYKEEIIYRAYGGKITIQQLQNKY